MAAAAAATRKKSTATASSFQALLDEIRKNPDASIPYDRLAQYSVQDFERVANLLEAEKQQQQQHAEEPPAVSSDAADIFQKYRNRWHSLADQNNKYTANRGVHDLGYDVFDERLHTDAVKQRVVVGFGNEDHTTDSVVALSTEQTETLQNEYCDPLAAFIAPESAEPTLEQLISGEMPAPKYAPNSVEVLAESFASGVIRTDAMLEEWWLPKETYNGSLWVSEETERRFRAWHASERRYRAEDDWRALLVPACARRYYATVHQVGHLKTLVLFAKNKVFLSVVLERHPSDSALYKLFTHYYTFSAQMLARLVEPTQPPNSGAQC